MNRPSMAISAGPGARAMAFLERAAWSPFASILLLAAVLWMAAAAGFSGFVAKWAFHDGDSTFGIEAILDRSAHKPFVYRQLVPMLSDAASRLTPAALKERVATKLHPSRFFSRVQPPSSVEAGFRYVVVYYISFAALFASLFGLRQVALDAGAGKLAATSAAIAFALAFPYVLTRGGFFYDSVELFFLAAGFLLASRGRTWALIALAGPATLNKEAFLFFVPALYPLLRGRLSARDSLVAVAGALMVAGAVNALVKAAFFDAPGGAAIFQLFDNVKVYLMPRTYFRYEYTYGLVSPKEVSILTVAVVAAVVMRGWRNCPLAIRQHALVAAAINLPLFLVFATAGELRNLSLLFVAFVVLTAMAIERRTPFRT